MMKYDVEKQSEKQSEKESDKEPASRFLDLKAVLLALLLALLLGICVFVVLYDHNIIFPTHLKKVNVVEKMDKGEERALEQFHEIQEMMKSLPEEQVIYIDPVDMAKRGKVESGMPPLIDVMLGDLIHDLKSDGKSQETAPVRNIEDMINSFKSHSASEEASELVDLPPMTMDVVILEPVQSEESDGNLSLYPLEVDHKVADNKLKGTKENVVEFHVGGNDKENADKKMKGNEKIIEFHALGNDKTVLPLPVTDKKVVEAVTEKKELPLPVTAKKAAEKATWKKVLPLPATDKKVLPLPATEKKVLPLPATDKKAAEKATEKKVLPLPATEKKVLPLPATDKKVLPLPATDKKAAEKVTEKAFEFPAFPSFDDFGKNMFPILGDFLPQLKDMISSSIPSLGLDGPKNIFGDSSVSKSTPLKGKADDNSQDPLSIFDKMFESIGGV